MSRSDSHACYETNVDNNVGQLTCIDSCNSYEGRTASEKDLSKVLEGKNLSTVTTGSHFMQFGSFRGSIG